MNELLKIIAGLWILFSWSMGLAVMITVLGSIAIAQGDFMVTFPWDEWRIEFILIFVALLGQCWHIRITIKRAVLKWDAACNGS